MACFWTGRAVLGVGALIAVSGVFFFIFKSKQIRLGLSLAAGLNGILTLLIPTVLIGVCEGRHMSCRTLTLPALTVLSMLTIAAAAVNVIYLSVVSSPLSQVREKPDGGEVG